MVKGALYDKDKPDKENILIQFILCIIPLAVLTGAVLSAKLYGTVDNKGFLILLIVMAIWYCSIAIYTRKIKLINSAKIRILIDKGYEYDEAYRVFIRYDNRQIKLSSVYKMSLRDIKKL